MAKKKSKVLDGMTSFLTTVGALNWGLVGIASFNIVEEIFGVSTITTVIYSLIGLSAIYSGYKLFIK